MDAWLLTVKKLFAAEFGKIPINLTELLASKARYTHLRTAEASSLYRLFEQVFIASDGTYHDWKKIASSLCKNFVSTK